MNGDTVPVRRWWGPTRIEVGEQKRWTIGPLRLRIAHLPGEWRIRFHSADDPHENTLNLAEPESPDEPAHPEDETRRFAHPNGDSEVTLHPCLADRPVVSHPNEPFFVLPGDQTRLYVGSPIWLQLRLSGDRELFELPILRPSDTWLGPTTGGGEAAYSSRTFCRTRLVDLPFRPHRSVTIVNVRNLAAEPLRLEGISLSVPHLSLYASSEGRLWTESVSLTRAPDETGADVEIDDHPPSEAELGEVLTAPRVPIVGNRLLRAVDALF